MSDEYLWPARNVAEYAYCPRLFYLMEVEGIHLPNEETEAGKVAHKIVDKAGAAPGEPESDAERPLVARSLVLTSETRKLTATLDLAEIEGKQACPVEYRKGRPCHYQEGIQLEIPIPWPTDCVQLGLQALLLREAGYEVSSGLLYYATEKRKLSLPITDELITKALEVLNEAQSIATAGERPAPLINDAKCQGCSLQPYCLPDELNYLNSTDPPEELTPRRMWPPRDDGIHLIIQSPRTRAGVRAAELVVTDPEGKESARAPLHSVESLSLLGVPQLTTQALHRLSEQGIPIAWLSAAGRMIAMADPLDSVSAQVLKAQILRFEEEETCLEIARALITAKLSNQRTILMRNHENPPPSDLREMARCIEKAATAESLDVLRGYEGQGAAIYFKLFAGCLNDEFAETFARHGRKRRPAPDPVNCCLSMAYTMLVHECTTALRLARLYPAVGAFHVSRPGRPSLSLDLMEPFRPLIADSVALTAFNRNELRTGHFFQSAAGCIFTDHGRKAFFECYGRRMETMITHSSLEYRLSYRRMIRLHARMIAAWLCGELNTLSFLVTR